MFSHNWHFNYRWHCYIPTHSGVVALSSVQLVWSQLRLALKGKFVFNKVSIIRHYLYGTCQGQYYVRQFEVYKSLYNIAAKKWLISPLC